ncbi:hypothetical protein BBJ28_00009251 [Nothophytophthora sp. Chile5]|nr:hypothetical protein BBJ28_00009251 [Nothophytophthora sp. Chile5]
MAAVRPISSAECNPIEQLRTPVPPPAPPIRKRRFSSDTSSSDSDPESSASAASSEAGVAAAQEQDASDSDLERSVSSSSCASWSSSASSEHSSDADSGLESDSAGEFSASSASEQEEDDSESSTGEAGRSATSLLRRNGSQRRKVGSENRLQVSAGLLEAIGDMARTDNVGFIAWLVPFTGISTMLGTEALACVHHFSCSENFPTLSYAATFKPEGHAFTAGMCLTAIFIFVSVVLFFWYLRLRMKSPRQLATVTDTKRGKEGARQILVGYACLLSGVTAASSLFGLAVMNMRTHHDAHINFTIAFFVAAWATMIAVQAARKSVLHEDESVAADGRPSTGGGGPSLLDVVRRRSFWMSLRRWRRLDVTTAYTLGRLLLNAGLTSTFLCTFGALPSTL